MILFFAFIVLIAVSAFALSRQSKDSEVRDSTSEKPELDDKGARLGSKRVRLTDQQIMALTCARFDKPIYGENPSLIHAQMPHGSDCFNIRTIESLVKRGFLASDGKGGYLLTQDGAIGLRSGMGF